jgi:hypothetical protein
MTTLACLCSLLVGFLLGLLSKRQPVEITIVNVDPGPEVMELLNDEERDEYCDGNGGVKD